jgi:hypothetical protein
MAHQELRCETVTLCRLDPTPAAIRPGAAVLIVGPVVIAIPVLVSAVVQHWPTEQPLRLSDFYFSVPDLRGPPQHTLDYQSCRGARSCAPHITHSSPRGIYAH